MADIWEDLKDHPDYSISKEFPFFVIKKTNGKQIKEYLDHGYYRLSLNGTLYYKHRLVAYQFLPNPNELPEVDHINHDRSDNHLINLRWVSHIENNKNRSGYKNIPFEFVDDIPDDAMIIRTYGNHEFEDLYYCHDVFYFFNGIQFRKLHICEQKNGSLYVNCYNVESKNVCIFYSKFKREYGIMT